VKLKAREAAREATEERRSRSWRPGGEHKDPREKFKKETFQARKRRDKKAANLAGESRGPAGVARVFRPAEDAARSPAEKPAEPGRPAPSHKTRTPRLRKPR